MKKHIIYTDYVDYDEWAEQYRKDYGEEPEWEYYYGYMSNWIVDERFNLDIQTNGIIAIADLGLWNGCRIGYKEVGDNISDCLYTECDYAEWYVDSYGRFCCDETHHDGTNYIIYKEWKDDVTEEQKQMVMDKIYMGTCTERILRRYTNNLGYKIAKIYGWNLNRKGA